MRIAYTADLHGNVAAYTALFDLALQQNAQAVVVGGDLLPRAIRRDDALETQRRFIEQELTALLQQFQSLRPDTAVYLLPGNDDWAAAFAAVEALEAEGLAFPLHQRVFQLAANLWLAGYACVPPTPFSIKDFERSDDGMLPPFSFEHAYTSRGGEVRSLERADFEALPTIAADLADLALLSDPQRTVYVCHTPPADTPLDLMPRGRHVGSRALRAFIERYQPVLTLHGHIHEAPALTGQYATRLGETWCINPGNDQRAFHGVMIDLSAGMVAASHTVYGPLDQ